MGDSLSNIYIIWHTWQAIYSDILFISLQLHEPINNQYEIVMFTTPNAQAAFKSFWVWHSNHLWPSLSRVFFGASVDWETSTVQICTWTVSVVPVVPQKPHTLYRLKWSVHNLSNYRAIFNTIYYQLCSNITAPRTRCMNLPTWLLFIYILILYSPGI